MAGRPRKAIENIEKLMQYNREGVTSLVREMMGHWTFDLHIMALIEKWVKNMDAAKYKKLRDTISAKLKRYEKQGSPAQDINEQEIKTVAEYLMQIKKSDYVFFDTIGWIFNAESIIDDRSIYSKACLALLKIRRSHPKIYQDFLNHAIEETKKASVPDNIIKFDELRSPGRALQ